MLKKENLSNKVEIWNVDSNKGFVVRRKRERVMNEDSAFLSYEETRDHHFSCLFNNSSSIKYRV